MSVWLPRVAQLILCQMSVVHLGNFDLSTSYFIRLATAGFEILVVIFKKGLITCKLLNLLIYPKTILPYYHRFPGFATFQIKMPGGNVSKISVNHTDDMPYMEMFHFTASEIQNMERTSRR